MPRTKAPAAEVPPSAVTDEEIEHFTTAEAAERLRMSKRWLAEQVRNNAVPCVRLGRSVRFRRDHILAISRMGDIDPAKRGVRRAA